MTSTEIRQSFLDFFKSKQHTIVRSSSLMPDSPNLLFTNAGMNQFVPIFLGQVTCPYKPGRAADTQKCIRAGGKHNDLEDVGLDTYHHTFFEMLGNWSFGDYFKKEAIEWAWELITGVWKFPKNRLYATVYSPDKTKGDPSEFDQEAYDIWARLFTAAGLDPKVHIVNGGKKDNFWMMGDTGPCGPCSELHVDLTPEGGTKGALVNKGSAQCIEIWNLVFIQFNANPDGTFSPLPARHVDTGMGFERACGIIQNTRGFTDFTRIISNYETDVFRPIFHRLEELCGKKYGATLARPDASGVIVPATEQEKIDIAFRVIADHIRTLSFAIADGIQPGNNDRNYVLRRILRRAVRYGRSLGFREPFFYKLVDVLAETMGDVFPEIRTRKAHIQDVLHMEEESFNKTLDRGLDLLDGMMWVDLCEKQAELARNQSDIEIVLIDRQRSLRKVAGVPVKAVRRVEIELSNNNGGLFDKEFGARPIIAGEDAFELYDTYGFPRDLTELIARERGFVVDVAGFDRLMNEQKDRARKAQKKEIIELSQIGTETPTQFVGYNTLQTTARVLEIVSLKDKIAVILDNSACYAEMGGQMGDTGELIHSSAIWRVTNTIKSGNTWLHFLEGQTSDLPPLGTEITLTVDTDRRRAIERHHTVTHMLHWALREVVGKDVSQKGSSVGPDKLTFDFNSAALTPEQTSDIEQLVNERILDNTHVSWVEVKYDHIRGRQDIQQCFGEKYGEWVRVVQIGGKPTALDGYSMELCGGTHSRATGEIGMFRIISENAIASGVRRIEAAAGMEAYRRATDELALIKAVAGRVNSPVGELEKKIESLLVQQKEMEKALKVIQQQQVAAQARSLLAKVATLGGIPALVERVDADGDTLQNMTNELKAQVKGVIVLGGAVNGNVALVASVAQEFTTKVQAGKIIQQIAPVVGGKGGGKPDNARGGGKDAARLDEALAQARKLLS
jgi:alanyl-tRNA synthetase